MPRAPHYITTPAAIRKSGIATSAQLAGCVNSATIELNGRQHAAKTVQFVVFAGSLKPDGLYHGDYKFVLADATKEHPAADFEPLFNGDENDGI